MFVIKIDGERIATQNDVCVNFVNNLSDSIAIYETEANTNRDISIMSSVDFSLGRTRVYTVEKFVP